MITRAIQMTAVLCVLAQVCVAKTMPNSEADRSLHAAVKAYAEDAKPFTVTIYLENDGAFLKKNNKQDRHYTSGVGATYAHQPEWAERFADFVTLGENYDVTDTAAGYVVGHQIYTPEMLSSSRLVRTDRPYAGYLYGGVYVQRANGTTFDHAQLDVGVVGPSSQADHIQNDIHDWIDTDKSKGWNNQLGDEVTAQLFLRRKWRTEQESLGYGAYELSHQWIPQVELALGSVYRHVSAGATWRIGHNLPDDFGPGRLNDVAAATGDATTGGGWYGFIRVAGRAVEHNLFLEGNSFKDSHGVDGETLVGEIQAGLDLFYHYDGWKLQTGYSQTFISEQFDGQHGSDSYGSLMLSVSRGL